MEFIITPDMSLKGTRFLQALVDTAPIPARVVTEPSGNAQRLAIYGVGHPPRRAIADKHLARGGTLLLSDIGYFATVHAPEMMRISMNDDHPQRLLDRAPLCSDRWDALHMPLRNDFDPKGPIVLVGLGPKTRAIITDVNWETITFHRLQRRFPGRRIIFRPKPRRPHPTLPCAVDATSPIETVLKGASLVVCRHSNVAVDAVVAGIPFEASDGAARWLDGKPYTVENRLEFLWRLMYFNWRADEAAEAWKVILKCLNPE